MMTAYFDCSHNGKGSGGSVAVSGWLSSGERWEQFDYEWDQILEEFQVPYFHMKEFAHSVGAYSQGWKGENGKRAEFIQRLVAAISRNAMAGFACLVERNVFDRVNEEFQVREYYGNEYALCGRICVSQVRHWLDERGDKNGVHHIFEDGDERGRLSWLLESDGYAAPVFFPGKDRIAKDGSLIRGLLPLQAADLAAYEMRKAFDDFGDAQVLEEVARYRKSFRAVAGALDQGQWGRCSAEDLRHFCNVRAVERRRGVS
ncbi:MULTISPECIES: DUF3800 domain-containing protein [Acidobacterium]|nr:MULTISPECIES: DUF3800 domain-containing protein [Acidobacterium]